MSYYRSKTSQRYGAHVSPQQARRVWAQLTERPRSSLRVIAHTIGLSVSVVRAARELLRDAGYVDYEDGKPRTTTILVPFHIARKQKPPAVRARG